MIIHDRETAIRDGEDLRQFLEPLLAVVITFA
jgi:hypothetical protein